MEKARESYLSYLDTVREIKFTGAYFIFWNITGTLNMHRSNLYKFKTRKFINIIIHHEKRTTSN